MMQRGKPRTGKITGADTTAHAFTAGSTFAITFVADSGNTGTVTITGADDDEGIPLAAGERLTFPGAITNLDQLTYTFSDAADILYYAATG